MAMARKSVALAALLMLLVACALAPGEAARPKPRPKPKPPTAAQVFTRLVTFLGKSYPSSLAAIKTGGLAPTVLSLLKAKKAITIFAPTEEAFTNFTLPIFCADQGSDVTNTTIKTTVLLHIVFGAYKNANLVNLDFGAQFKGPTPVPLVALPGYVTTTTGSIQVGYIDGTGTEDSPNILNYTNIVDRDAFASSLVYVHGVDTVLTYPSLL